MKNSVKLKVIQAKGPIQTNSDAAQGSSKQQQLSLSSKKKKILRDNCPKVTTVGKSDLSSEQLRRLRLEAVESRLKAQSTRGNKNGTLNTALNQQKSNQDRVNQAINKAKRKEKDKNLMVLVVQVERNLVLSMEQEYGQRRLEMRARTQLGAVICVGSVRGLKRDCKCP
ncbi:hypothetical protein BY996DRAFT_6440755 [Phakopsora pachyrhizi]|nr:hypothetical protein BY996DRAFT_6440755 [Phakopsora pachyrhizi]